jgi:hypothetical protein
MANNKDEYQTSEVVPPWRVSEKGAVYCKWENVPNDISSQLKMENGCTKTIDDYSYYVKGNEDGTYIVFKNTPRNHRYGFAKRPDKVYTEIQILPIQEANKLLAGSGNQFELIGTDPIKVINQQFFVALGKKVKVG